MGQGDTLINSLIGAVITVVASFIPFSPVLGGAVAGYLQQRGSSSALKVGALSGAISLIPFVLVVFLIGSVFSFSALPMMGSSPAAGAAGIFGVFFIIVLLFAAVYTIGLGALGGYVGYYVQKNQSSGSSRGRSDY